MAAEKGTYEITPTITVSGVTETQAKDIEEAVEKASVASSMHITDWKTRHVWGE